MKSSTIAMSAILAMATVQAKYTKTNYENLGDSAEKDEIQANLETLQAFSDWVASEGRSYPDKGLFNARKENWIKNDKAIKAANERAAESGVSDPVRLRHNQFSDLSKEERIGLLGGMTKDPNGLGKPGQNTKNRAIEEEEDEDDGGRRNLCDQAVLEPVDWVAAGKVGPVKDQGSCSSDYAMNANTIIESMIAIQTDSDPVPLSDQQIVDCSRYEDNDGYYLNFGCYGGRTVDSWFYGKDYGLMSEEDYPFKGRDLNCKYDQSKVKVTYGVENIEQIGGENGKATVEDIATALQRGPVSAIINGDCDALWFYSGGVLRASDCLDDGFMHRGHGSNHYVTLVAYQPPTEEPYTINYTTKEMEYRNRNRRDPRGGCAGKDEWYWDYWNVCCWVEETTHTLTIDSEGYYVAQNNFGEYWGMSGSMMIAAQEGSGFAGMNHNIETITLKDITKH